MFNLSLFCSFVWCLFFIFFYSLFTPCFSSFSSICFLAPSCWRFFGRFLAPYLPLCALYIVIYRLLSLSKIAFCHIFVFFSSSFLWGFFYVFFRAFSGALLYHIFLSLLSRVFNRFLSSFSVSLFYYFIPFVMTFLGAFFGRLFVTVFPYFLLPFYGFFGEISWHLFFSFLSPFSPVFILFYFPISVFLRL